MSDKRFVDTNIWVYAHLEKPSDAKWSKGRRKDSFVKCDVMSRK